MYYDYINIKETSLEGQETMESIDLLIKNAGGILDKKNVDRVLALENDKTFLSEILAIQQSNERKLLVFKMAMYRFCTVHLPCILKELRKSYKERTDNACIYIWDINLAEWEDKFWKRRPRVAGIAIPIFLVGEEAVNKETGYNREMEEIIDLALLDTTTVECVKQLQEIYVRFALKAKNLNKAIQYDDRMQKDEIFMRVQHLKTMVGIVEKNILGTLTAGDVLELEEQSDEWNKSLQMLVTILESM